MNVSRQPYHAALSSSHNAANEESFDADLNPCSIDFKFTSAAILTSTLCKISKDKQKSVHISNKYISVY